MRIRFNEGAVREFRDEAVNALVNAKSEHDKLEAYYIKCIDFDKVDSIAEKLENELQQIIK